MSELTPEQARAALADVDRHVHRGRAATLLPLPLWTAAAVAIFVSFASGDLPAGWVRSVVQAAPLLVVIPVAFASRLPAIASALGIHAAQREQWRLSQLGKQWWLYMSGLWLLVLFNGIIIESPSVIAAVRFPHTVIGGLVAAYLMVFFGLWRRQIRKLAQ